MLPTYSGKAGDGEPLLESLIWLLLTSEVPTKEQVDSLTAELHERSSKLPKHVVPLLNSLPKDMHPMTQFSIGLNAAQTASVFAKAYGECCFFLSLSLFPSPLSSMFILSLSLSLSLSPPLSLSLLLSLFFIFTCPASAFILLPTRY